MRAKTSKRICFIVITDITLFMSVIAYCFGNSSDVNWGRSHDPEERWCSLGRAAAAATAALPGRTSAGDVVAFTYVSSAGGVAFT